MDFFSDFPKAIDDAEAKIKDDLQNKTVVTFCTGGIRCEKANLFLQEKKFEKSLEKFIEIIRTDRYYADDIARKACIAIFKFLGEENEITSNYRRDFGRALYV